MSNTLKMRDEAHKDARFAELSCRAASVTAKALVELLRPLIEDQEMLSGIRKYRRGADAQRKHRRDIGAFLGDLLLAANKPTAQGWCYRSLKAETFNKELVSYRGFKGLLEALKALGFVEHHQGQQRLGRSAFVPEGEKAATVAMKGMATRYRATPELLKLVVEAGIVIGEVRQHFSLGLPRRPLVLKASSQRFQGEKISGVSLLLPDTPVRHALETEVRRLNAFLDGIEIGNATHSGYRRIFNEGDHADFAWNRGGRLYGSDDGYQRDAKKKRLSMTIDGSPVVEIDITASYLTLLHALQGVPFDPDAGDPYAIAEFDRDVTKAWTTATLGNRGHLARWPTRTVEKFREKTGKYLPDVGSAATVRRAMEAKHPILSRWDEQTVTWSALMYYESKAVVATMVDLMDHKVPSLCVHDSIIVRADDQEKAREALERHYEEVSGIRPRTKTTSLADIEVKTSAPLLP